MAKMRALRYLGPGRLEVALVERPEPGQGEVLIRVRACGICGSDVHGYLGLTGRRIPPMTMGHEFSGEIAQCGAGATRFQVGDAVVVQPIHFCGTCANCRQGWTNMCLNKRFFGVLTVDGANAEYVAVPEKLLYALPKGCSYEIGALTEPYAVGYGSIQKAGDLSGKRVFIIGAGMIGLCILQLAKLQKPEKIIVSDLSSKRLEMALSLGADAVINPGREDWVEAVKRETDGEMADVSIEAVGVEATANQSIKSLKIGGKAIWVGMSQKEMTINMQDIVCSARSIDGTFNYTHQAFGEVVTLLGGGDLSSKQLISKVVSLEEAPQAYRDLHEHPDDYIKVIIDPSIGVAP